MSNFEEIAIPGEGRIYFALVAVELLLAAAAAASVLRVTAPYGRHMRPGFGPTLSARRAWVVMESPPNIRWPERRSCPMSCEVA